MPRRHLIRQGKFPYHVTSRTNNKEWFNIPLCDVWDICKKSFINAQAKCPVKVHCFVLMSNHYHLLLTTPNANIDRFMMLFNAKMSKLISQNSGVINHKFSNRYKWTIVDDTNYLLNIYRYIYQNPVRAKLTEDCLSYPYSSLHFSGFESKLFNHQPHIHYANEKSWLEKSFGDPFNQILKRSLTRGIFKLDRKVSRYHRQIFSGPRD